MSQDKAEVARQAQAAFNSGDASAFAALLTADAEIVPMRAAVEETAYRGPDAAQRFFADLAETWQDLRVEELETQDLGDRVFATGVIRGRGQGSGAAVEMQVAWVTHFQGELVSRFVTFTDLSQALEAAGLSE